MIFLCVKYLILLNKIWISYVDARNITDLSDLDHLKSIVWGANPHAMKGDFILIYRISPFSDIKYIFTATANARKTVKADLSDTDFVIDLGNKIILPDPVRISEIKKDPKLKNWSFAKNQQGMLKRVQDIRSEGYWEGLVKLIRKKNKSPETEILLPKRKRARKSAKKYLRTFKVFINYASENYTRVNAFYKRLRKDTKYEYWFDKQDLLPHDLWFNKIVASIQAADAIIMCISKLSNRKKGFLNREIAMGLKLADKRTGKGLSIFPVKLEPCDISNKRLSRWQYAELFRKGGFQKLVKGLNESANSL